MDILSGVTINGDLKVVGKITTDSFLRNDPIPQIINGDYKFSVGCLCTSTLFWHNKTALFDPNFPPVVTAIDLDTMKYVQMDYEIGEGAYGSTFCPISFIRSDSSEEKTYRFSIFGVALKESDINMDNI